MILNKLYCDRESFRDIEFEDSNINIILGKKTTKDNGKTFNGVGKTLSLRLIDFCLGSSSIKSLQKLDEWNFSLDFKLNDKQYTSTRNSTNQKNIILNNEKKSINDFKYFMESNLFYFEQEYKGLSYRNLISRFMRIPPYGYLDWDQCKDKEQVDVKSLSSAFLLGLNIDLAAEKVRLKEKIKQLKDNKKLIEKDEDIKAIVTDGIDISVSINNLKKDIEDLGTSISQFNISEEYNDIKIEIDDLKYEKNDLLNQVTLYENRLKNINESLKVKIDVNSQEVINLYENSKLVLPDMIKKSLNEVSDFHYKLLDSRQIRLRKDREKIEKELKSIREELNSINKIINENTKYLSETGSISEYESLQNKLTDMKLKLQKTESYNKMINGITQKINDLKVDFAKADAQADKWLIDNQLKIENVSTKFKEYIDYIYNDKKEAGISVKNNTGDNKIRFNIEPMVSGEGSMGINKVKVFCMDFINLTLQNNHNVRFIYHDNNVFSETDPRQIYKMLKLAKDICINKGYQYILNINNDVFDNVIEIALQNEDNEFAEYMKSKIVIELLDSSDESKLLGTKIDMKID